MKDLLIGSGDPGGLQDGFAFVLDKVDRTEKIIYVLGARGWKFNDELGIDYNSVERDIARIHKKQQMDFFICEKNNTGLHVIQSLKNVYHIPVIPIWTGKNIKSERIINAGKTMDKNEHVGWINRQRTAKKILFPKVKTEGINILLKQLNSFVKKTTQAGTIRYEAEGTIGKKHDDFVMAFMVNTYYIRRKIFGDRGTIKRTVITKKPTRRDIYDKIESAIPKGSQLTGRDVMYPTFGSTGGYRVY